MFVIDKDAIRTAIDRGWVTDVEAELMTNPPDNPTPEQRAQLDRARNRVQGKLMMEQVEERTARP